MILQDWLLVITTLYTLNWQKENFQFSLKKIVYIIKKCIQVKTNVTCVLYVEFFNSAVFQLDFEIKISSGHS